MVYLVYETDRQPHTSWNSGVLNQWSNAFHFQVWSIAIGKDLLLVIEICIWASMNSVTFGTKVALLLGFVQALLYW